jgi:hypothetical protein
MADVPGRCRELDYCSIGQMRTLVRVPLGRPFVCPECGKPLREPVLMNEPLSRKRIVWWSIGTLGLFALLYECAVPSDRPKHLPPAQIAAVLAQVHRPPAPPPPAPAAPMPAPAPLQAVSAPPAPKPAPPPPIAAIAAAPIPLVLGPPVPTPLANAPLVRMPAPLPPPTEKPAAPGAKVTMECTVDAAGVPSNCTPAKVQAPPAAAPKPPPPPPPPADREPSVLPVAGGGPPYPTDYVRDGRAGEVAVDCTIDPDGEPEHCRVRDVFGGRRFAEATVDWLNSGTVRFKPALRRGVPVAEERHWRIAFPPRR